jgi:hypothetical protein
MRFKFKYRRIYPAVSTFFTTKPFALAFIGPPPKMARNCGFVGLKTGQQGGAHKSGIGIESKIWRGVF